MGVFPDTSSDVANTGPAFGPFTRVGGISSEINQFWGTAYTVDIVPTAGSAFFFPFVVDGLAYAKSVVWQAGAIGSGGGIELDFGIYSESGSRLASTGTVGGVLSTGTVVTSNFTTPVWLNAGFYFLAYVSRVSNASVGVIRGTSNANTINKFRACGIMQSLIGAGTNLPASTTLSVYTSALHGIPGIGLSSF